MTAWSSAAFSATAVAADHDDDDADVAARFFFPSPRRRPSSLIRYIADGSQNVDQATILSPRCAGPMRVPHNGPGPVSASVAVKAIKLSFSTVQP